MGEGLRISPRVLEKLIRNSIGCISDPLGMPSCSDLNRVAVAGVGDTTHQMPLLIGS